MTDNVPDSEETAEKSYLFDTSRDWLLLLTLLGVGLYFSTLLGIIYFFPHTMLAPEENGKKDNKCIPIQIQWHPIEILCGWTRTACSLKRMLILSWQYQQMQSGNKNFMDGEKGHRNLHVLHEHIALNEIYCARAVAYSLQLMEASMASSSNLLLWTH